MSNVSKGNYYRLRTKNWLKEQGYLVENLERMQRIFTKGKVLFIKRDLWGADLIALKPKEELIFIQVKSNKGDIAKGIKELGEYDFPEPIKRWVIYWPPRSKEPEICQI